MLKKIGRISFAILLVLLMVLTIVFNFKNTTTTDSDGHINIIVKNIDGDITSSERFEYKEEDSLFDILNNNYKLIYENTKYGHYLLGIDDIKTDTFSSWLWLELAYLKDGVEYSDDIDFANYNCQDSNYGIDGIEIKDNMILGICERDNTHQTSIFSDGVINNKKSVNNYKIFKIITYTVLSLVLILSILYGLMFKNKNNKLTIRKMCILSLMAVILFVQEEVLTFLPNIQLTFLLISLYAAVFGIRYSLIVVLIHVILDNIVMGSFTPIVMIPMLIGYVILVVVMYLVRDEKIFIKVIFASMCSWIYCMVFLIANAIWLDIDVKAYFIADIPFEILLILSTIFTITYLYNPLYKVLYREWNKDKIEGI